MANIRQLPHNSFACKPGPSADAKSFYFDIKLHGTRPLSFFGLITMPHGADYPELINSFVTRIEETIKYQNQRLEGNKLSVTQEDFYEQCLQRLNQQIKDFLHEIPKALPLHTWGMVIGMTTPDMKPHRTQFYISRFGNLSGYLINQAQLGTKKLIPIFDTPDMLASDKIPQKFFTNIASSVLSNNDQLFFCTPNLFNLLPQEEIKRVLVTLPIKAAVKQLENLAKDENNPQLISAFHIGLAKHVVMEKEDEKKDDVVESMNTLASTEKETQSYLENATVSMNAKRIFKNITDKITNPKVTKSLSSLGLKAKKFLPKRKSTSSGKKLKGPLKPTPKNAKMNILSTSQSISKISILKNQIAKSLSPLSNAKLFFKRMFVGQHKKKMIPIVVIPTLLVIIISFVSFKIYTAKKQQAALALAAEQEIEVIRNNIDVIDSHLIVGRDSDATRLLQETFHKLNNLPEIEDNAETETELATMLEDQQRELRKEFIVSDITVIEDRIDSVLGQAPEALVQTDDAIYIVGANPRQTIQITESNQPRQFVSDLNEWTASGNDGNNLVFASNTEIGVFNPSLQTSSLTDIVIPNPINALEVFNNRIYALSSNASQIFKTGQIPNFGTPSTWVTDLTVNLSSGRDIAIDGSIYVLTPNGVIHLLQGDKANPHINLQAVDPTLSDARKIWTNEDSSNIYILEPDRLLAFQKTGKLLKQYKLAEPQFLIDFTIDESTNSAYLLSESQLIRIGL